jgi:hypothetical protein
LLEPFKTTLTGGEAETPPAQPLIAAESYGQLPAPKARSLSAPTGVLSDHLCVTETLLPSPSACLVDDHEIVDLQVQHRTLLFNIPSFITTIHECTKPDRFFKYSSIDFCTSEGPHLIIKPAPFKVIRQGSLEAYATQRSVACYSQYLVRQILSNEGKTFPSEEPHNLTLWRSERFEILGWH